ncbi:MAG: hypothetical protein IJ313_10540 [Clostridia bacterium]|nr:hypothetical protein [Clostridia bacterium]
MIEDFLKIFLVTFLIISLFSLPIALLSVDETLEQGVVIGKEHKGSWMQLVRINGTWYPINHPETFTMTVQGNGENGETITDKWKVDEEFYNRTQIGDHVNLTED